MTIQTTPVTIQSGGETAEQFRRMFYSEMGGRPGVVGSGDLQVTQNGTPNMSVNVADGRAFVLGSESTTQGLYHIDNRGTTNLPISASHASLPRNDLIVARIRDAAYSGATNSAALEVVTGTAAGSPVDPTVPANCLVLARVVVPAASTTVTNAFIDDLRAGASGYANQNGRAAALGGLIPCTASTRPSVGLYEGIHAYETDTDIGQIYNGSVWMPFAQIGAWSTYTPTLTQSATVSKTLTYSRYIKLGRLVIAEGVLAITSSGTANNPIQIGLPVSSVTTLLPVGQIFWLAAGVYNPTQAVLSTTSVAVGVLPGTGLNLGQTATGWSNQLLSGQTLAFSFVYESAS